MSKEIAKTQKDSALLGAIEQAVTSGNIDGLNPEQKMFYYNRVCESVGLNPLTRPLDFIRLNGKTVLYARKDATDQLRKIYGVSVVKIEQQLQDGCFLVTAYAKDKSGKEDCDMGAVPIAGLKGEQYANAILKCITKAKRRVTLSICGMGLLDESEFDTVPEAMEQLKAASVQAKTEQKTEALKAQLAAPKPAPAPIPEPEVVPEPVAVKRGPGRPAKAATPAPAKAPEPIQEAEVVDPLAWTTETAIKSLKAAKTLEQAKSTWDAIQAAISSKEIDLEAIPADEAGKFIEELKAARAEVKARLVKG